MSNMSRDGEMPRVGLGYQPEFSLAEQPHIGSQVVGNMAGKLGSRMYPSLGR